MAVTKGVLILSKISKAASSIALFLLVLQFPLGAVSVTWGTKKNPFQFAHLQNLKVYTDKNGNQQVSLQRYRYPLNQGQAYNSLYASFDHLPTEIGNSRSKEISLSQSIQGGSAIKASFHAVTFNDSIGGAISFEQPQHQVWIDLPEYLFLNQSDSVGDFSIHFMLRPYQLKQEMEIFRKMGLFEGRRRGMRCLWKKGQLSFEFLNLFKLRDRVLKKLVISTQDPLVINSFQTIVLRYSQKEGSLTLFMNGREQEKIYVTDTMQPRGSVYTMAFHPWDRSPLIIGKNYLGALDELILSNSILPISSIAGGYGATLKNGNRYQQPAGTALSKVFSLNHSSSELVNLTYQAEVPGDAYLNMYYRISDKPFPPGIDESVLPFQKVKQGEHGLARGRYIQYKLEMYADPLGQKTPRVSSVSLLATENRPPQAPRLLEVAGVSNNSVTLRFLRNAEMDVIQGGRYHVYYGVRPYQALGVIRYKKIINQNQNQREQFLPIPFTDKDRLFTDDLRYQNRIEVTITNEMILEHIAYAKNNPRFHFPYPVLQNRVPYYFWVTACDNAYSENPEHADHESKPSNTVVARPGLTQQ